MAGGVIDRGVGYNARPGLSRSPRAPRTAGGKRTAGTQDGRNTQTCVRIVIVFVITMTPVVRKKAKRQTAVLCEHSISRSVCEPPVRLGPRVPRLGERLEQRRAPQFRVHLGEWGTTRAPPRHERRPPATRGTPCRGHANALGATSTSTVDHDHWPAPLDVVSREGPQTQKVWKRSARVVLRK